MKDGRFNGMLLGQFESITYTNSGVSLSSAQNLSGQENGNLSSMRFYSGMMLSVPALSRANQRGALQARRNSEVDSHDIQQFSFLDGSAGWKHLRCAWWGECSNVFQIRAMIISKISGVGRTIQT